MDWFVVLDWTRLGGSHSGVPVSPLPKRGTVLLGRDVVAPQDVVPGIGVPP